MLKSLSEGKKRPAGQNVTKSVVTFIDEENTVFVQGETLVISRISSCVPSCLTND